MSSCGFHLRGIGGSLQIPPELKTLYLQSDAPYASFEQTLRSNLRANGITVLDEPNKNVLVLRIINYTQAQMAGSVSSNLQTRQYTLTYTVNFELLTSTGVTLLPSTSVSSITTFTANVSQMLMTANNISLQYVTSLENDATFRLLNRLLATDTKKTLADYFAKHPLPPHEN
jgi:outer membrane lipopolysaccharide assembly protein LptE/RlpB